MAVWGEPFTPVLSRRPPRSRGCGSLIPGTSHARLCPTDGQRGSSTAMRAWTSLLRVLIVLYSSSWSTSHHQLTTGKDAEQLFRGATESPPALRAATATRTRSGGTAGGTPTGSPAWTPFSSARSLALRIVGAKCSNSRISGWPKTWGSGTSPQGGYRILCPDCRSYEKIRGPQRHPRGLGSGS